MLPNEEDEDDALGALLRQSYGAAEPTEQFVDRLHERLLSELTESQPARVRPLSAAGLRDRSTQWLGGLTMRQRLALGGVGMTTALGLLLLWMGSVAKPVSAMEKMAENVRQATSYKCTVNAKITHVPTEGKPPLVSEYVGTQFWRLPDLVRWENTVYTGLGVRKEKGPGIQRTSIHSGKDKPWLEIDNRSKTFHFRPPAVNDSAPSSAERPPAERLEDLGKFCGDADRRLGTKQINGKEANGFLVDHKKIDLRSSGTAEIWLDSETNLPVLVRYAIKNSAVRLRRRSSTVASSGISAWIRNSSTPRHRKVIAEMPRQNRHPSKGSSTR